MSIIGRNIGKKYAKHWVFRKLHFDICSGTSTSITGDNGSGKSTLLQIISGYLIPSEGALHSKEKKQHISLVGPYSELIEELTLREFLKFHRHFKTPLCSVEEMADRASLPLDKQMQDFSTGMKQRVKLILSFYFDNHLTLMDEPTSNLDRKGAEWWREETLRLMENTTLLIASNQIHEVEVCKKNIYLDE